MKCVCPLSWKPHFSPPSSSSVSRPADWMRKLDALVLLAGRQAEEKKKELASKAGAGPNVQVDAQKNHRLWTLRQQLYCRMRRSFQLTGQGSGVRGCHTGPFSSIP